MATLGVDTSNYATSLAVFAGEVVCAKKQFLPVKEGETGLRQSDAVFHHTNALPQLLAQMQKENALRDITAVGVSQKPRPINGSYMPCFLAGVSFASAFAAGAGVPLLTTTHQQGHIAAALYACKDESLWHTPAILFHISGGTTEMLLIKGIDIQAKLGESLDLYAGQAVDRLGVKLGFAFPAGEALSTLALTCGQAIKPRVSVKGMDCHLSGLQNQCEKLLQAGKDPAYAAKYCLLSVAETIVRMVQAAHVQYPGLPVICAGGVMCSEVIRPYILKRVPGARFVAPQYSSDNAIGAAVIAAREVANG